MNRIITRHALSTVAFSCLLLQGCGSTNATKESPNPEKTVAASQAPAPAAPSEPVPAPAPTEPAKKPVKAVKPNVAPQHPAPVAPQAAPAVASAPAVPTTPEAAPPQVTAPAPAPTPEPPPAPPAPIHIVDTKDVTVPAGTEIVVRMIDSVDAGTVHEGDVVHASIDTPLSINNEVVLPKGSDVYLKVTKVNAAGELRGKSELHMELDHLVVGRKSYSVESNAFDSVGADQGKKTVRNGAIGAAIGAAVGAIAGGGKGAAIGAGAGAGGGVGATVLMNGDQVRVPSETRLVFTLTKPVDLSITPGAAPTITAGPARLGAPATVQPSQRRPGQYPRRRR